jgi:hypothetical protein
VPAQGRARVWIATANRVAGWLIPPSVPATSTGNCTVPSIVTIRVSPGSSAA